MPDKKYLDQEGLKYLWSRTNMQDYPNNEILMGVINAIDETKQDKITGAASTITTNNLTSNMALISDASGKVGASTVTTEELGYLSGTTSNIQNNLEYLHYADSALAPGALKWDGVIGDKDFVIFNEGPTDDSGMVYMKMGLVHVSDEYPSILQIAAASDSEEPLLAVIGVVEGEEVGADMVSLEINPDGAIFANYLVIIPSDNYNVEGFIFPKKGVYFMAYQV